MDRPGGTLGCQVEGVQIQISGKRASTVDSWTGRPGDALIAALQGCVRSIAESNVDVSRLTVADRLAGRSREGLAGNGAISRGAPMP